MDGQKPPDACDKGGPNPAKSKMELLIYLRDSFAAIRKSLGAIDAKNMFDPIEGPYACPSTHLGLADLAQRRPLRPDDAPAAPERHHPARQPPKSTRAPRQLLRFCGVLSFVHKCAF